MVLVMSTFQQPNVSAITVTKSYRSEFMLHNAIPSACSA